MAKTLTAIFFTRLIIKMKNICYTQDCNNIGTHYYKEPKNNVLISLCNPCNNNIEDDITILTSYGYLIKLDKKTFFKQLKLQILK